MIPVTKTFLPPQEEYQKMLDRIWESRWITNRGELVLELERKLKDYLKSPNLFITTNGTIPIQIAIRALALKGEIITTPFSYVATASSIIWEHCAPVFVDIDQEYLNIDETKIEAAITNNTVAILPVHVFGNPCDVEAIEQIGKKHSLKIIYDAAHAFGVRYKGVSIFHYGDVSTCSFHATKLFHTGEGGAIFINNLELYNKAYYHHNFGHNGQEKFHGLGINGKITELQAAMGLALFPYVNQLIQKRKKLYKLYKSLLKDVSSLTFQKIRDNVDYNYAYFPVIFKDESQLLDIKSTLQDNDIYPRRYFYPSLQNLPYINTEQELSISSSISKRILCLPLYYELTVEEVEFICNIIIENI